ncbi:Uncharacterised protein [Kingella potus]|uniref:Uncharacterized protein n=1 Tax=Kingella potus TaxID=265175 RepID=A0A377QZ83_9NEIS|nr:Uncharacterised protein [Kingella potus]
MFWNKAVFNQTKRKLHSGHLLYTQLYLPSGIWTIALEFSIPPSEQGYESMADKVYFPIDGAPHGLLADGFEFDFFDGKTKIGKCVITR